MFSLKSHQNTALPHGCNVGLNPKKQSDSACFCSHFLLHKQTGILLFKHMLGNKALWKWCEPGAGSSQGVKSTLTARILRFVILPVTALQGVPISKATKVGQSSVLNAKSPFQAELHHPEGILVLSSKPWQPPSAMQASGPGFFVPPRSCLCCPQGWEECNAGLLNREEQVRRTDMKVKERLKGIGRIHTG